MRSARQIWTFWPLQAWPEDIARYEGRYREGWAVLRRERYERLLALGLIQPERGLSRPDEQAADRTKPPPYPKQSSWEFYQHVRDHVVYVHIKDGTWDPATGRIRYTFAGEGDGDVRRIVTDLLRRGYDGGFSIEPHLGADFHDPTVETEAETRFRTYVEYGRRFARLVEECRQSLQR